MDRAVPQTTGMNVATRRLTDDDIVGIDHIEDLVISLRGAGLISRTE